MGLKSHVQRWKCGRYGLDAQSNSVFYFFRIFEPKIKSAKPLFTISKKKHFETCRSQNENVRKSLFCRRWHFLTFVAAVPYGSCSNRKTPSVQFAADLLYTIWRCWHTSQRDSPVLVCLRHSSNIAEWFNNFQSETLCPRQSTQEVVHNEMHQCSLSESRNARRPYVMTYSAWN